MCREANNEYEVGQTVPIPPCHSALGKEINRSSISQASNNDKRKVSFSSISIREHSITIGDHPDCKKGVPITLDWFYNEKNAIDINEYEIRKEERIKKNLVLTDLHRKSILFSFGHTHDDLAEAIKDVDKERKQRKRDKMVAKIRGKKDNFMLSIMQSLKNSNCIRNNDSVLPLEIYG